MSELWETPEWRADKVARFTAQGISLQRADELVEKMLRRYREEADRDAAHDSRMGYGE